MRIRPSGLAWFGLVLYVSVVDIFLLKKKQTFGNPYCSMSEAFGDAVKHPKKRWPIISIWGILTIHLFGVLLPNKFEFLKKLDPIGFIARKITNGDSNG